MFTGLVEELKKIFDLFILLLSITILYILILKIMKNFLELTKEIYDKETAIEVNKALKEY
ncbi:MAG: hypothetical protein LBD88_00555 [Candidatus Peribacteria bacterium]|jgi:hypothetical protein|nr:hypothetical protein [Candidatus Peribacteria bacterium]